MLGDFWGVIFFEAGDFVDHGRTSRLRKGNVATEDDSFCSVLHNFGFSGWNGLSRVGQVLVMGLILVGSALAWCEGAIDPRVTQANIQDTICRPEWVRAARLPVEVTTLIKHQLTAKAGVRYVSDFQLERRVPLRLGGARLDERNLQLQHWGGPWNARCKDALEAELCKALCEGLESSGRRSERDCGRLAGVLPGLDRPKGVRVTPAARAFDSLCRTKKVYEIFKLIGGDSVFGPQLPWGSPEGQVANLCLSASPVFRSMRSLACR
jgi:hypothetical protein